MSLLVPTTLNHHSSRHRRPMRNRSCHRSSSLSNHSSPTGSRIPTTGLMLAVSLPHHLLPQQVLVARQPSPRPRAHCPLTLFVLLALLQKFVQLWRTERHLHATDTRDHTSTMLTLLLLVVLPVALLRQPLLKQQRSRQLAIAKNAHQPHHQSDTANGRTMSILQSLRATRKNDKRWKSLTAAVRLPHTA